LVRVLLMCVGWDQKYGNHIHGCVRGTMRGTPPSFVRPHTVRKRKRNQKKSFVSRITGKREREMCVSNHDVRVYFHFTLLQPLKRVGEVWCQCSIYTQPSGMCPLSEVVLSLASREGKEREREGGIEGSIGRELNERRESV